MVLHTFPAFRVNRRLIASAGADIVLFLLLIATLCAMITSVSTRGNRLFRGVFEDVFGRSGDGERGPNRV
jgi:hypothetical protein